MPEVSEIERLRRTLDAVDEQLVELAARRQELVSEIGRVKQRGERQLRDFRREREVIERVRARAESVGLPPELAESLFKRLIEASLTRQEVERVRTAGRGRGQRALVIGGAGRMGGWLARFLDNQGFDVMVADPAGSALDGEWFADWREAPLDAAVIVLATPPERTGSILAELADRRVPGLVFDVASMKSTLVGPLREAAAAGLRVCSLHPMFGPDTRLLSDQRVLVMEAGNPAAADDAAALFVDTMARVIRIDLAEHDRLMAPVLGLSQALTIVFFAALERIGLPAGDLEKVASTTFGRQLAVARNVAGESPALYYEIQAHNEHGKLARDAFESAVRDLNDCVERGDRAGFEALMKRGRAYLDAIV